MRPLSLEAMPCLDQTYETKGFDDQGPAREEILEDVAVEYRLDLCAGIGLASARRSHLPRFFPCGDGTQVALYSPGIPVWKACGA